MMHFMDEQFLLDSDSAKILYHDYAKKMPIYDYHCHLSPKEIAENKPFDTITQIWLAGDHYKWRAMRSFGVDERLITGDASDKEKFRAWIETLPYTIGNPLYHWSHMELKRYFNFDGVVQAADWEFLWNHCQEQSQSEDLRPQSIIQRSQVKVICTTDDPVDSLQYHKQMADNKAIEAKVLPTFRPDRALEINKPTFQLFVEELGAVSNREITELPDFLQALENRVQYFHEVGCRVADHGFEFLFYETVTLTEASTLFAKACDGKVLNIVEETQYKTFLLQFLAAQYSELGWVMQWHIGAIRNNNTKRFNELGPDSGFDSINDFPLAKPLNQLLNSLERKDCLPKTIIYTLNPNHNDLIASTIGNFQASGQKGKIQFGSGWWYNDKKTGMMQQMTALAEAGLISTFVGMLTDSRSFLSYTRHEYFRRILCQLIGGWMEAGEVPRDYEFVGQMVQDISFYNAKNYFQIEL
ncbi:glucuronate isomerase [Listeria grandensis]|uniref:Uronate isomerase n=1 Tax=Listeria grandensis TaxID=1494963 RepID=A0A7X0Y6F6_9LIST|nr:glucuronate isomerase [Listeria grandensis]MBC1937399.1 glucuronate isomerase [Listeria grandensis]